MDGWMRLGDDWCESKGIQPFQSPEDNSEKNWAHEKKKKRKIVVSPFPDP